MSDNSTPGAPIETPMSETDLLRAQVNDLATLMEQMQLGREASTIDAGDIRAQLIQLVARVNALDSNAPPVSPLGVPAPETVPTASTVPLVQPDIPMQPEPFIRQAKFKLPEPDKYTGRGKSDNCLSWVISINRYIKALQNTGQIDPRDERSAIGLAEMYTSDIAARWFARETLKIQNGEAGAFLTLQDALEGLKKYFIPIDDQEMRARDYENLRQTGSARDFWEMLSQKNESLVKPDSANRLIRQFRMGLKKDVRDEADLRLGVATEEPEVYRRSVFQIDDILFKRKLEKDTRITRTTK